ncbi:hypothetical protein [Streptomyces sp. RTd22]|uniref:hypothetical protein n=1 Tax=Streptomyces sp. RTd22 TaxID=1841249 RepID=UPI0013316813|nr:hypothetical protein [Streptomyces sp. RTd22]
MNDAHTSRRRPKRRGRRARRGRGRRVLIMAAVLGPVLAAVFVAELATEGYWRAPVPKPSPERTEGSERPVADRTHSAEPGATRTATPSKRPGDHDPSPPDRDEAPPSEAPAKQPPPQGTTRAPAPTTHAPPTSQAAPAPTPTTPSPTCTRFLWWCA